VNLLKNNSGGLGIAFMIRTLFLLVFTATIALAENVSTSKDESECIDGKRPRISYTVVAPKGEQLEYYEEFLQNAPSSSCVDAMSPRGERPPELLYFSLKEAIKDGKVDILKVKITPEKLRRYVEDFDARSEVCSGLYFNQPNGVEAVVFINSIFEEKPEWSKRCFFSALTTLFSMEIPGKNKIPFLEYEVLIREKLQEIDGKVN
jgi:hypothetical protein